MANHPYRDDDRDGPGAVGASAPTSITVVSNREPYGHVYTDDGIAVRRSQGGLTTALSAAVNDVGGRWIAWGSESADFDPSVVTDDGVVRAAPDGQSYTLERVDLDRHEVETYYYGYSNQVLWPLFHLDTNYVDIAPGYWEGYRAVNERFARRVLDGDERNVWFHDYHLTLAPRFVREETGDSATLVQFIHIPWPPAPVFEICPHADAVLDGLLANDHLGFQHETHRAGFLDCVEATLDDAQVDRETGVVEYRDSRTVTFVQPVGIDADQISETARRSDESSNWQSLTAQHAIDDAKTVCVGVDRLDYTKGILERLDALSHLWERRPDLAERMVYVQKATRSRDRITQYRRYQARVRDRIYELNDRYGTSTHEPIVYVEDDVPYESVLAIYRNADVCLVSSKRDGMNLVAQEYVAASRDTSGVLVLSKFAGVADVLRSGTLVVNPFHVDAFADAIEHAVTMDDAERSSRMVEMQDALATHSIDDWLDAHLRLFA